MLNLQLKAFDGEPRMRDIDVAKALGFERPRKIRDLIRRHLDTLASFGEIVQWQVLVNRDGSQEVRSTAERSFNQGGTEFGSETAISWGGFREDAPHGGAVPEEAYSTVEQTLNKGGRFATEYWLNEEQALFICTRSDAPNAVSVVIQMVRVFAAWRNGRLENLKCHGPAPGIEDASLREREFWLSAVRETRLVAGPKAARRLWSQSQLPPIASDDGGMNDAQDDEIAAFLDDCCEATGDPADFVRSCDLIEALHRWQDGRRLPRMGAPTAARRLSAQAGRWRDRQTGRTFRHHKRSISGYAGLRLVDGAG